MGYFQRRGDNRFRKGAWPTAIMAAHEVAYAAVAPCESRPVTRVKLLSDDPRLDLARKPQQARTRACSPVPVNNRKLLQCDFLDFAQICHALLSATPASRGRQASQIQTDLPGTSN